MFNKLLGKGSDLIPKNLQDKAVNAAKSLGNASSVMSFQGRIAILNKKMDMPVNKEPVLSEDLDSLLSELKNDYKSQIDSAEQLQLKDDATETLAQASTIIAKSIITNYQHAAKLGLPLTDVLNIAMDHMSKSQSGTIEDKIKDLLSPPPAAKADEAEAETAPEETPKEEEAAPEETPATKSDTPK